MARYEGITYKGTNIEFEDLKAVENAAEAFSTSQAYATGDYCTNEGTLYQFVADHSAGAWNAEDVVQVHISDKLNGLKDQIAKLQGVIYGIYIDSSESDPSDCVTYLSDAVGMTPAHMDYTAGVFDYGSWENAFFMPRPCMLKYDGTVDYYLDPNDYSKKIDGTASDVGDTTYGGNAMMEWGRDGKRIWYSIEPKGDGTSAIIYVADYQVNENFKAYNFINKNGSLVDHFYTPCYFGSLDSDGRLRSLSGIVGSSRCKNKTAPQERIAAKLNNPSGVDIWDFECYADNQLITILLWLMGKSLDVQTVFGKGLIDSGTDAINNSFTSGQHNAKGLFFGTNSGAANTYTNAVKVFGMENFWGFMWRRELGYVNVNGTLKYKLTAGTKDGSTDTDYVVSTTASDYDGYLSGSSLPSASGSYIKKMTFGSKAMTPTEVGGSASTYYCDTLWTNLNAVCFSFRGGDSHNGALCGTVSRNLHNASSNSYWNVGAAPSCKPLS